MSPSPAVFAEVATDTAPGCGPAEQPEIVEDYTPVERQGGAPAQPPIRSQEPASAGEAQAAGLSGLLPTDTSGRALQYQAMQGSVLVSYYGREAIGEKATETALLADGGFMVLEQPNLGEDIAARASRALGKQATSVRVGSHEAVINHGDEIAAGVRPYLVFWTDRGSDWIIQAGEKDPAVAIDLARSVTCQ